MRAKLILLALPLLLAFATTSFAVQYYITIAVGSGGTVSPQKGKLLVEGGESPAVTYTAQDGYYLGEVKVDKVAVPINNRKVFTYQFNNVQAKHAIAAKFIKDPVITAKGSKGGTVTPSGKIFVPYSTSKSFSFAPLEGYHLASVVADRVNLGTPENYTFNYVKTKHSLSAKFVINTYPVTTQAGDGGFIAPASLPAIKHGQKKVFTIKPDAGMRVATVTVNGTPAAGPFPPSGPYKLPLTITGETLIAATFTAIETSSAAKLQGTYQLVGDESSFWKQTGNTNINEPIGANKITATFDGKGGCKLTVTGASYTETILPSNGSESVNVDPHGSPSGCTYTVGQDGAFTLNITTPDGPETIGGWASTDGNVAIIGGFEQTSGSDWKQSTANTISGVKSGSGISKTTAAGTYHLINRESSLWKSVPQQDGKTYVFDHYAGNRLSVTLGATGSCSIKENGIEFRKQVDNVGNEYVDIDTWTEMPHTCSYTISSNGTFTLTIVDADGTFKVTGWSSADGNAIVMGGADQRTESEGTAYSAEHIFGVREGSSMNAASVNGTYRIIGSDFSFHKSIFNGKGYVNRVLSGRHVTATFDGAGGCTLSYNGQGYYKSFENGSWVVKTESDAGTMSACSYTVAPDGAFTLNLTSQNGNDTVNGRVSADGSTVLMGGPDQDGDDYTVTLMVGTKVK